MQKNFFLTFLFFFLGFNPLVVLAQGKGGLDIAAGTAGLTSTAIAKTGSIPSAVGLVLGQVLMYLGILFFLLIVYAGFLWLTAQGNDNKVEKAKNILIAAVSGLVIVLAAYAIVNFVFGRVLGTTACDNKGGKCISVEQCDSEGGTTENGLCPGDQNFKCCIPKKQL